MLKIIDKKLFKQIFGDTLETLANKLTNTTNKKENQIIVKNINAIKEKFTSKKKRSIMIGWSNQIINLIKAIKLILDFNESELKELALKYKN